MSIPSIGKRQAMSEYESSWEWTVERSNYHFDNTRVDQPGEWFTPLGQVQGDWQDELAVYMDKAKPITWETRKESPYYKREDGTYETSGMIEQENNDLERAGFGKDLVLTDVIEREDLSETFVKMYEYFGVDNPWVRLHLQAPGQMFNLHIDKLYDRYPDHPEEICRIVINLTDWEPGQFYAYGTHNMSHWRAGDAHCFDWSNIPHATANCSRNIRPTMMITGVMTDRTKELVRAANRDNKYIL